MAYIDLIIITAKAIGIILSGFFGVYGLLNDYKVDGEVTQQGKVAIFGIAFGAVLSALAFGAQEIKSTNASVARELALLAEAKHNRRVLDNLNDIANQVNFVEATIELELNYPSGLFETDLAQRVTESARILTTRQQWECKQRVFLAENEMRLSANATGEELPFLGRPCEDFIRLDSSYFSIPPIRVSFFSSDTSTEELGFLRIDPDQQVTDQHLTEIIAVNQGDDSTVNLIYDDVPVRFRTNQLRFVRDFAGVQLEMLLLDDHYRVEGFKPTIKIVQLDLDMSDGRDLTLYANRFDMSGGSESGFVFLFKFPDDPDDLNRLFQEY